MAELIPTTVYALCLLAATMCAVLLYRGFARTRQRLLLWSAVCFTLLALNSLAVVIDLLVVPGTDLRLVRHLLSLAAVGVLLYGLIWEDDQG